MRPVLPYGFQRSAGRFRSPVALDQIARIHSILPRPEDEDDLTLLAVKQFELKTDSGAWIETGAQLSGQARLIHGGRIRKHTIAPQKLSAVSGNGPGRLVGVKEGDPAWKL